MSFPADRFYHRGHTWAHPEADGTVTIGLDDLGARLLGTPDEVILPEPGTQLRANGTAFRVRRREADVRILSPVDGEVVETGGAGPRLYFLRVQTVDGKIDMRHLLRGAEVKPWMMREMERLQLGAHAWKARPCPASPMAASQCATSRLPIRGPTGMRSAAKCSWSRNPVSAISTLEICDLSAE